METVPAEQIVIEEDHAAERHAEHMRIFAIQEDCLVSLSSIKPRIDMAVVRQLPPWRAVMIARIAYKCRVLPRRELDELTREAQLVGGMGTLKPPKVPKAKKK